MFRGIRKKLRIGRHHHGGDNSDIPEKRRSRENSKAVAPLVAAPKPNKSNNMKAPALDQPTEPCASTESKRPSNVRPSEEEGSLASSKQQESATIATIDNNERPNRSVNDFQSVGDLKQALISDIKGSYHDPVETGCSLFARSGLEGMLTADPTGFKADIMKDIDQKLDWVLENYDKQTSEEQSLDHELRRLLVLKSYLVLDTERRESFERITGLASRLFNCPIAVISLVDLGRQWFLSNRGLGDCRETPRKLAFCAHAIMSREDCLIVPDATKDARFKENPLVTGPPDIRFYAGAPLLAPEGYKLGTLCVIDYKTRQQGFSSEEKENLKDLSAMAVQSLVDHRRMKSVWFNNLMKTKYPEFEDSDANLAESSDDESVVSLEEDRAVAAFLKKTKHMSMMSFLSLLQSQARELNLSPDYLQKYAALAESQVTPATPEPEPVTKQKRVRFSEDGGNHKVCAEIYNVESWKDMKELWWSAEEMHAIRIAACQITRDYRKHRPQFTHSVEIVATNTQPKMVVEDHMRQLTEDCYARGLESHIVSRLSCNRKATVKAVLRKQSECLSTDNMLEVTLDCLRGQSLAYSQLSTQFAEKVAQCDQIGALTAIMSQWCASPTPQVSCKRMREARA